MSYPQEPDGEEWFLDHDEEEQEFIKQNMNQCPECGEWINKSNRDFSKEDGPTMCRLCELKQDGGYEDGL